MSSSHLKSFETIFLDMHVDVLLGRFRCMHALFRKNLQISHHIAIIYGVLLMQKLHQEVCQYAFRFHVERRGQAGGVFFTLLNLT